MSEVIVEIRASVWINVAVVMMFVFQVTLRLAVIAS
jgi:hypothetical protein